MRVVERAGRHDEAPAEKARQHRAAPCALRRKRSSRSASVRGSKVFDAHASDGGGTAAPPPRGASPDRRGVNAGGRGGGARARGTSVSAIGHAESARTPHERLREPSRLVNRTARPDGASSGTACRCSERARLARTAMRPQAPVGPSGRTGALATRPAAAASPRHRTSPSAGADEPPYRRGPTRATHRREEHRSPTARTAVPRTTKPEHHAPRGDRAPPSSALHLDRRTRRRTSGERERRRRGGLPRNATATATASRAATPRAKAKPPAPRTTRQARRPRPTPTRPSRRPANGAVVDIERFDRSPRTCARCSAIRCSRRRRRTTLAVKFVDDAGPGRRRAARHGEPAARGEDRLRVPARLQEHHGPHPGGEHRPDAGREALRPLPRREALVVRGVVDPRVHPAVHPEQLAPREARDDAGAAQALLQPAKEARRAPGAGDRPDDAEIAKQLNVPESEVAEMDVRLQASEKSLDAPVGDGEGRATAKIDTMPSLGRGARGAHGRQRAPGPAQGEARRVPQDARGQGQGPRHLRRAPRRRRAAHAAGARRPLRHLARARAPARAAPDRPAARVPARRDGRRGRSRRSARLDGRPTRAARSSSSRRRSATSAT